jgi:tetratricopeptide (TPR) repeat protein
MFCKVYKKLINPDAMKSFLMIFTMVVMFLQATASDTLFFRPISYSQLFDQAKEENKVILLYFYFDGCRACKLTEKNVFTDTAVAGFFNGHFICFEINTRIVWIINREIYQAIDAQDEERFRRVLEQMKEFDKNADFEFKEMDGRWTGILFGKNLILKLEAAYNTKAGIPNTENAPLQNMVELSWDDYDELNEKAWSVYLEQDDPSDIREAVKWIKRSIKLNSNYHNNDTYAALLYKSGDYERAMKYADRATEMAKAKEIDYSAAVAGWPRTSTPGQGSAW